MRNLRNDGRVTIDVTAGTFTGLRHQGVRVHNGASLRSLDVDVVDGIPVTSVARTLLDCAPVLGRRGTEKLVREAEFQNVIDVRAIRDLMRHVSGHPGCATMRAAIGDAADGRGRTASPPEDALLAALREIGVSGFECNVAVALGEGTYAYPDFLFRTERLVVEADPRGSHDRTSSYRSDRQRDRALKRVSDLDTMRFSDEDMLDPHACALEVAQRLVQQLDLRTT